MLVSSSLFYCIAGELRTLKNSPSFLPFSSVSGGYQLMSAGLPSKKSGFEPVSIWLCSKTVSLLTRHENLVLVLLITSREDICPLQSLWEESEDVVHHQYGRLCVLGPSGIGLHALYRCPFTLLLIAIGNDRWHSAACVRLRHGGEVPHSYNGLVDVLFYRLGCSESGCSSGWKSSSTE